MTHLKGYTLITVFLVYSPRQRREGKMKERQGERETNAATAGRGAAMEGKGRMWKREKKMVRHSDGDDTRIDTCTTYK